MSEPFLKTDLHLPPTDRRRAIFKKEEVTLALLWLEGRLSLPEVERRMTNLHYRSSAYSFLATRLKLAYEKELIQRG